MVIVTTSPAQILPPPPVAGFEAYFTDQELVCALVPFHVIAELQCPPPNPGPSQGTGRTGLWVSLDHRESLPLPPSPQHRLLQNLPGVHGLREPACTRVWMCSLSLHLGLLREPPPSPACPPTYHPRFPLFPSQTCPEVPGD